MSWNELPTEVLYVIFKNVENLESISKCQYTCKSWYLPAQHVLYEKLWFVDKDQQQFTRFLRAMKSNFSLRGNLTKAVHFGFSYNQRTSSSSCSYLLQLAKFCPNIEEIKAFSPVPSFYEEVSCASLFYWNRLKTIPRPYLNSYEPIGYGVCVFHSRNSLQEVCVSKNSCNTEFGRDFLSKLSELPFLKKISILEPLRPRQLDDILQRMPYIRAINIISVDELDGYDYIKPSQVCNQIKSIEGVSISFEQPIMDYFMDKFPRLEHLEMNLALSTTCLSNGYHCSPARFLQYIDNIPKYDIRIILHSHEIVKSLMSQLYPTEFSLCLDYKKILITLNDFTGTSKMCFVYIPSYTRDNTFVRRIGSNDEGIIEEVSGLYTMIVQMLESCGEGLKTLSLDIALGGHDFQSPFKDILYLCPNLKTLHVKAKTILKEMDIENLQSNTISSLSIDVKTMPEIPFLILSNALPDLRRLKLNIQNLLGDSFILDMPYTNFNYLYIGLNNCHFDHIILKVNTQSTEEKAYKLEWNGAVEELENMMYTPDIFIRCQSLKTISLRLKGQLFSLSLINYSS